LRRKITILGSTGSIGRNCLDVIRANKNRFDVVGLAANSNSKLLAAQAREFRPEKVSMADKTALAGLRRGLTGRMKCLAGEDSAAELVESVRADVVVSAIAGAAGLGPTLVAIKKGIRVCVANKEPFVMAGKLMMSAAKRHGATIIPIDSEHSALWQCLNGERLNRVKKLILTASGGPFLGFTRRQLARVTPAQALKHPRWKMGPKITVDSSTLINKGLEVIEARWLFNMPAEKIDVMIHPQSIVHSMVEFVDRSVVAQLGLPDMRLPIAYALSYPDRWPAEHKSLDLVALGRLDFMPPDTRKFPCLALAYEALEKEGIIPATLNAANEVAVEAFLKRKIKYLNIPVVIHKTIDKVKNRPITSIKSVLEADLAAREVARSYT
jgi:1-deoxy-D-xylulose-5-phosphate reductoisomerase